MSAVAATQTDGGAGGWGAFWPATPVFQRVPIDQRWRLLFDRRGCGAPETCIGWGERQRAALAAHAVAVRRWLHPILGRLPSRDELAVVVGVELELLDKVMDEDGRRTMALLREKYGCVVRRAGNAGAGRGGDWGVA